MATTQYLANTPPDPNQIQEWVEEFHRDGYLFLKNVLPPTLTAHLRADLDRALVQAAIRNQVQACVWLVDEARYAPAEALEAAQLAASAACATDAEWLLISERIAAKRRERKKRRGRFDDLF